MKLSFFIHSILNFQNYCFTKTIEGNLLEIDTEACKILEKNFNEDLLDL